ncbi:MAG: S9 family peptidase [Armatimonadota bacterium]|nr:S9 family peptidase [Armatimonadota bacterium]MDR7421649.1 S9 family peptidase [Armatimonadota bacterium]MDR7455176.1 S9 family peptidase [Armatimonadota bacterium]MDR7455896.1 S9 family peptidase [Armatimonadota bacterium]MDR7497937.1 S9 family peptidase [Armatimonadota bacterium]
MARRAVEIDDLLRIRFPHHAALSPDGRRVVFALGRLDQAANEWRAALWVVPVGGGEPRPFTADEARDASPVWSPDGRWLAFLSTRGGRRLGRKKPVMQLWVMPADGGEARQLTHVAADVAQPAWSPDGETIAFVTRATPGAVEGAADDEPPVVRAITRARYKFDGLGFLDGYSHVWTVPVTGGEPARVTDGDFDHEAPAWLPGGGEIVFVANRTAGADFSFARDLWAADARTGALRRLTEHPGPALAPAPSPDGRWVAFVGHDFHAKSATNMGVWVVPAEGGEAVNLTAAFDRSVGNAVGSDARLTPSVPSIAWTPDGSGITFYATDRGSTHLYRVTVANRWVHQLTAGAEVVADLTAAAGTVVYQRMAPTTLDELWVLPPLGEPYRLVAPNDALSAELELAEPRRFVFRGADAWPMDGWVLTPPGFDPRRRYPAILRIHGGPHAAYGDAWNHYVAVLAARGYVVVWTNPRGSQGYGEAFARAVVEDWGGKDSQDILLGLDHAIGLGFIDPDRVAVTGGSYGGFMTNWLIGHTTRFRCALTEVCVSNLHSFYGTSDIGATWGEVEWGASPWEGADRLLRRSPITYAPQVTTPVLITANEADHRCPVEQSEQFFIALRKLGKEAEFLRFSGESHLMSSAGRPKPRLERLRRAVAWFDRHLGPAAPAAAAGD